ncbi:peptidase [Candidatus Parcubacteria bacterium]|nr:MAG: peptidase [Candidatus Parcubacteria bacterium]
MIKSKLGILLGLIICVSAIQIGNSYGHGLGFDIINTASINGKKLTVTTQITPTVFSQDVEKRIFVSAIDSLTNQNVENITYRISLFHEGGLIFSDYFFAEDGIVDMHVTSTADGQIQLRGEKNTETDTWYKTESKPIEIIGPVLNSGGLYHFEIEIRTIDDPKNIVENPQTYVADVTVVIDHDYEENDKNGNDVKFGIRSYYDKASSFDYNPDTNAIYFEMPFDWDEKNISHVPVVHEEVHFPKEFVDFFVPSYVGKVNGIDLFKSSVTVDDYSSEEERIVHFIISQDNLTYLKQAQKAAGVENPQNMQFTLEVSNQVVFPAIAMTKNEEIQVDLSWDPIIIEPNKNTKFIFTFRDAKTGEPLRNTTYELIILQNGKELYKKLGNARIGGDFVDYTFLEKQTGPTSIKFEKLRGTDMRTEFGITVVPEFGPLVFAILPAAVVAALIISKRFRI